MIFLAGTPGNYSFHDTFMLLPTQPFLVVAVFILWLRLKVTPYKLIRYFPYQRAYYLGLFYLIYLIFIGIAFGMKAESTTGLGVVNYLLLVRFLILVGLILLIPYLFIRFNLLEFLYWPLIFILVINFIIQSFYLSTGLHLSEVIGSAGSGVRDTLQADRAVTGWLYGIISLMVLGYLRLKKIIGASKYYFGIVITVVSFAATGSRGYLIAALFFIVGFELIALKRKMGILKLVIGFLILGLISPVIYRVGYVKNRVDVYSERFGNMFTRVDGKYDVRQELGEVVLEKAYSYPLTGFGYSDDGITYYDQHTGNQSIFLAGGLIGLILYVSILVSFLTTSLRLSNEKRFNRYKLLIFFFLLIIHSTSTDIFSPYFSFETYHYNKVIILSFFLGIYSIIDWKCESNTNGFR